MKSSKIVCLFAGLILVTMIFSSCGGGSNPGKNKIAPTPTSAGTTPAPTIAGTTPTPTSIGVTPTPTSLGVTPTPTSAGATHTPTLTPTPIPTVAPTPTPYQFNCNFDSFPLGAWTLPANWSSNTSSAWAIVNPDSSNNKVQHTINGQTFLTCPYNNTIGGNNYTITAKVRVPTA
ncbi:MAG TPA: hypothetical protein VHY08_18865, partial [Bacillota bacterium]|nr:hypothetical protein [Bacillota bacterium]